MTLTARRAGGGTGVALKMRGERERNGGAFLAPVARSIAFTERMDEGMDCRKTEWKLLGDDGNEGWQRTDADDDG